MTSLWWAVVASLALFVGMLACLDIGFRLARWSATRHPGLTQDGIGAMEAGVFALLGLLLGFSFAGGTSRLDARRQLVVQEANSIGTAYLRLDLLAPPDQPQMRHLFREYVDARVRVYEVLSDTQAVETELAHAEQLQKQIWSRARTLSSSDATHDSARLLLPAINEMMDVTTARTDALHMHLPPLIFSLLVVVALLSSLLAGYATAQRKRRSWLHMVLYAGAVASTVYVVIDLDNPRLGWIELGSADKALIQVRDSIRLADQMAK